MGRNHLREQVVPKDPTHLLQEPCGPRRPSGLSLGFPRLSPSRGQLDYVLLARPPLYSPCGFHVRLACLIHAANVRSEPGSNPSLEKFVLTCRFTRQLAPAGRLARPRPRALPRTKPRTDLAHTLSFEATRNVKDRSPPRWCGRARAGQGSDHESPRQARARSFLAQRQSAPAEELALTQRRRLGRRQRPDQPPASAAMRAARAGC